MGKEQLIIWIFLSRTSSLLPPTSIPNRHLTTVVLWCYCTNLFTYSYSPIDFKVPKSKGYVSPDHTIPRPFVTVERKEDNAGGKQMERKEGKDRKSTFSDQCQDARRKENRRYGHWSFSWTNSLDFFLKRIFKHDSPYFLTRFAYTSFSWDYQFPKFCLWSLPF